MTPKFEIRLKPMESYSYKAKTICRCSPMCKKAVQFIRTWSNEVEFVLCEEESKLLGSDILKQTNGTTSNGRYRVDSFICKGSVIKPWTPAQEQELQRLCLAGMKYKQIAKKMGRTLRSIKHKIEKLRKKEKLYSDGS